MPAACDFLFVKAGVRRFIDGFALDQLDHHTLFNLDTRIGRSRMTIAHNLPTLFLSAAEVEILIGL